MRTDIRVISTTENEPYLLYATRAWAPLPFDPWKHSPHNTRSSFSDSQISYNCSLCCVSCPTLLVCLYQSWVWKPQGFCLNTPGKKHITSYFTWYLCTSKHYSKTVLISETNKTSRAMMCYCFEVFVGRWKIMTSEKKPMSINRNAFIHYLDGLQSFTLMIKVVEAVHAVTVITELPIGKAITIPVRRETLNSWVYAKYNS